MSIKNKDLNFLSLKVNVNITLDIIKSFRNLQQSQQKQMEVKVFRFTEYINKFDKEIVGFTTDDTFRENLAELIMLLMNGNTDNIINQLIYMDIIKEGNIVY